MTCFDNLYAGFIKNYPYPRALRYYKNSTSQNAIVYKAGNCLIDFSTSDYMGLAKHPFLIARTIEYAQRYGTSCSSSRLIRGNLDLYENLEVQIAQALGTEAALIFGAGFQTNATVIEAIVDEKTLGATPLLFLDKACHASIYAGAFYQDHFLRFHHNDLRHLETLLVQSADLNQPKFIFTESVYCMDGDQINLTELVQLAKQYQAALYVDEAHAVGVYGKQGWGLTVEQANVDIIMGTFSKALGSFGAYIGCSTILREYLIHRCKGFIYSTGLPPPVLGAIAAVIELLPQLTAEREHVKNQAEKLRHFLHENNLDYGQSNSHIVPWIIGDAKQTRSIAQQLEQQGILAVAIQPPTVPPGKSRIRFCLSALHSDADLEKLFAAIKSIIIHEEATHAIDYFNK